MNSVPYDFALYWFCFWVGVGVGFVLTSTVVLYLLHCGYPRAR
jgi:hypothetical protein